MKLYRDTGVVLRTYRLGEADRIVVLFTAEHGKVRAVAKGVRRTQSRFGARLEPASQVRLLLHRGRDLDVISQAELVDNPDVIRSDLDRMTQALSVLEVIDVLSMDREPDPARYRMLVGVLATLSTSPGPLVVPAFFWKLLAAEGVRPELDMCVTCGVEDVELVAFDVDEGGALCRGCRRGVPLSPDALSLMRLVLGGGLLSALAAPVGPATYEVGQLAVRAMEHHLDRRLRAVSMFERQ
jgi:DNA repair protein RecO (recombination protein O)